jgi:sensor histidine kinase YesM
VLAWQAFAHFLLRDQFGMRLFPDYLGQVNWMGVILYHTWMLFFFGGLATVAAASQRRYARMLAALRAAELARATSQRGLADAKLASLQARIPPNFLFQTLTKLERLYAADPASADRLLDELIDFLHRALADMRASTVPSPPPVRAPHVVFHSSN